MKRKKILLNVIFFLALSFIFVTSVSANTGTTEISGTINYDNINEVLRIVNEERSKENLSPLVLDSELTDRAITRAYEISYLFEHTRPNGSSFSTVLGGLSYTACGENIAYGQTTASAVMNSWMNSEDHMKNIMGKTDSSAQFTTIGIGNVTINGVNYWVQLFTNHTNSVLNKTGSETINKTISVIIPDGELDFGVSSNLIGPGGTKYIALDNSLKSYSIFENETPKILLNGYTVNLYNSDITYSSDDNNVATITGYGIIWGVSEGETKVHVNYNGVDYPITVKVTELGEKDLITNIELNNIKTDFKDGDTVSFTTTRGSNKYDVYEWWQEEGAEFGTEVYVFEAGKSYSYHANVVIAESCGYNCYFDYSDSTYGTITVLLNGEQYELAGVEPDGKTFILDDNVLTFRIPASTTKTIITDFVIENATLDVKDGDSVRDSFTATSGSDMYSVVEVWMKNFEYIDSEASDGSRDREGRLGTFEAGNRYSYSLEIKLDSSYSDTYALPSYDIYEGPINVIINGTNYEIADGYYYVSGSKLVIDDFIIKDITAEGKEIVYVDKVEVKDAVYEYMAGDKPVYTATPVGDNVTVTEQWMQNYYRLPYGTGGIWDMNTSSEELNNELKEADTYFDTFESAKGYNYTIEFKLSSTGNVVYMFPADGEVTVIVNGTEYEAWTNDPSTLWWNDIDIEIPIVISDITYSFEEGDTPVYTATYDDTNYTIKEYWHEEGSEEEITVFEANKQYYYSILFNMKCTGPEDEEYYCGDYYFEYGQQFRFIFNEHDVYLTYDSDTYGTWIAHNLFGLFVSEKEQKGSVIVNYVDINGKPITDSVTLSGPIGDGYSTYEKYVRNWILQSVEGETNGVYQEETIYVTYIYEKYIPITMLSLEDTNFTLTEGDEKTIQVIVNPVDTTQDKTLDWSSNNEESVKIIDVSTTGTGSYVYGTISALKEGYATITVTASNGVQRFIYITVNKKLIPITKINVSNNNVVLTEGEYEDITYTIKPDDTTDSTDVTWVSKDESVATVIEGRITAVSEGSTTVVVTASNGVEEVINVNVTKKEIVKEYVLINELRIDGASTSFKTGDKVIFTGTSDSDKYTFVEELIELTAVDFSEPCNLIDGKYVCENGGFTRAVYSNGLNKMWDTFQPGLTYSYNVRFNLKEVGNIIYVVDDNTKVYINGNEEKVFLSDKIEDINYYKTIVGSLSFATDIPYNVSNVKKDFNYNDVPSFTGVAADSLYSISEIWSDADEDDIYKTGVSSNGEVSFGKTIEKFEAGKKYNYSILFAIDCSNSAYFTYYPEDLDRNIVYQYCMDKYNIENGKKVYLTVDETEYELTYTIKDNTWLAKNLFSIEIPSNPITDLILSSYEVTLIEGEEETITYSIDPEETTDDKTVTWVSSNESVAAVVDGKISALSEGSSVITATTSNGIAKEINVTVNKKHIPIERIVIEKKDYELTEGEQELLSIQVLPDNHTDEAVFVFEPEDSSIADVENGYLVAKKEGSTRIRISIGDIPAVINVTVNKKLIPIADLVLSSYEVTLTEGEEETITYNIDPEETTDDKTVTWVSSNESVAAVVDGKISALSEGSSVITATTSNGIAKEINVTVNRKPVPVTGIELTEHEKTIYSVDSVNINVIPSDADINWDLVSFSSSDESILVVTSDGTIYPVNIGSATITATYGDYSDECIVTIPEIYSTNFGFVSINGSQNYKRSRRVYINSTDILSVIYNDSNIEVILNNSNNKIEWATGWNEGISVDEQGNATFSKVGEYYVKAILGAYYTEMVTYYVYDVEATYEDSIYVEDSTKAKVRFITPANASSVGQKVWKVDNSNIATVSEDGTITGVSAGTVNVTVYDSNQTEFTYTFQVEVKERDKNIFEVFYDEETDTVILRNSNGVATLVIDDITEEIDKNKVPEIKDKELIAVYDIHFELGDNSTFENPIYIVRIPITFNIKNYSNLTVVYIKDGNVVETFDYKIIDNKYIEFTTTHFSNYAIYGTLKTVNNNTTKDNGNNPYTGDSIIKYFNILFISLIMLSEILLYVIRNKIFDC